MNTFVNVTLQVPVDASGKLLLPDNLRVGGDLNLRGTAIRTIPQGVKVSGKIYGLEKSA